MPEREKEKQKIKLQAVCERCGKLANGEGTSPSFTNWIFGDNRCHCAVAENVTDNFDDPELPGVRASTRTLDPGTLLQDRYEIGELIGQGGMGRVYRVYDRNLEKSFAAKVLNADLVKDATSVKRFEQEAQAAASLTHANLVAVYDYGQSEFGSPFIVMDYLEGEDLAAILRREGFVEKDRALDIIFQTSEAVSHAHKKGVIHRDLKPGNIFVTKSADGNDIVKVLDFGIAKIHQLPGQSAETLTQTGELFGSPLYMSPEQCLGNVIDPRSDVYAVGCVLYELLTGQSAFGAQHPIKIILKHINEDPKPPSEVLKDGSLSKDLDGLVMRCLEKDPGDRYESMDQFIKDLRALMDHKPIKIPKRRKKQPAKSSPAVFTFKLAAFGLLSLVLLGGAVLIVQMQGFFAPLNAATDAQNLDSLSFKYFSTGQYEKAIPLLEFGVKTYKDSGGREDAYLADNLQHIGKCYLMLGKYQQAEPYYQEALEIYKRLGSRGAGMREAIKDYSTVLSKLGRAEEAAVLKAKYGSRH
jgi:serine/threonine protein kinase